MFKLIPERSINFKTSLNMLKHSENKLKAKVWEEYCIYTHFSKENSGNILN